MQQDSFKFKLLSIFIATVGLISLLLVFFLTSPYQGTTLLENGKLQINLLSVIGIYVSLWMFFAGLFAIIFFWLRSRKTSSKELYFSATTSLRQGVLIGCLVCVLLFLQSANLLIWWDALLVIFAIILIEMYLAVSNKHIV